MAVNTTQRGTLQEQALYYNCEVIVPNDTAAVVPTRGISSNNGGMIVCRFKDSTADVTIRLVAGVIYDKYVIVAARSTGTTIGVGDLFGYW